MDDEAVEYALAKQIPENGSILIIDTDYGQVLLDGDIGKAAVKALRNVLANFADNK